MGYEKKKGQGRKEGGEDFKKHFICYWEGKRGEWVTFLLVTKNKVTLLFYSKTLRSTICFEDLYAQKRINNWLLKSNIIWCIKLCGGQGTLFMLIKLRFSVPR